MEFNIRSSKALRGNIDRVVCSTFQAHQKKLKPLTKNCVLPFNSKEAITNLSSHKLTDNEREALQYSLSHSIVPMYINKTYISICFATICQSMTSRLIDKKDERKLKADLSYLAQIYANSFKPSAKDNKTHKALKNLRKNSNVIFLKLDKGKGVLVVNKEDHIKGILDMLNGTSKVAKFESDPTINIEGSLQRFLRYLKNNGKIFKDM